MSAWMLVLQKQSDLSWLKDYIANVPSQIKKHGGRYLGVSSQVINIENHLTERAPEMNIVALFEFPSRKEIEEFMSSDEYQPYAAARKNGSRSDIYILDNLVTEFP
jgi:uncharacterized protein (DUF1330 family)